MANIQLLLDFGAPTAPKSKTKSYSVSCQECDLPIDLILQSMREIKACPHCDDRTWLLNLKTKEACILYAIKRESLGGRLKNGD